MEWNARDFDPDYPFELLATKFDLDPSHSALIVVDMQRGYLTIDDTSPIAKSYPEIARRYNTRTSEVVIPSTVSLLAAFRSQGLKVVYTRNGCMTSRGDEMTRRLRVSNNPPKIWRGAASYEIADAIRPEDDELVIDKLTSGAFTASALDDALRNLGVMDVVVTGLFTDMCVLGTARVAAELGYNSVICEDCCAALTERAHREALLNHARRFGRVSTVSSLGEEMNGSCSR